MVETPVVERKELSMEEDAVAFKEKFAQFLEEKGITDEDIREDTGGECATVAEYIEKLAHEYYGEGRKRRDTRAG
jgi:hypothetical protein